MSSKPLVILADAGTPPVFPDIDLEAAVIGTAAEVQLQLLPHLELTPDDVGGAVALIVSHLTQISAASVRNVPKLKVIVRCGIGFDNIDIHAAAAVGIPVCNVPDYGTEEVADHAIALALALLRRIGPAIDNTRAGNWDWRIARPGHRLSGLSFGILGCGRTGTATALRAKAFGMKVQFFDPYAPSGYQKALGIAKVESLQQLLSTSDVVSLHAPLTPETRGIIGSAEFALMKPGAMLVNTARGPLVQEQALLATLESGRLGGAALDVVENEPAFAPQLLTYPNLLLTPHIAFYSEEALVEMRSSAARNVLRVLQGQLPTDVVNGITAARS